MVFRSFEESTSKSKTRLKQSYVRTLEVSSVLVDQKYRIYSNITRKILYRILIKN